MASKVSVEQYEEEHVHFVYEQIALHFSSTRYKPWPVIERFLKEQPSGAIGLDVGCGNGKYLVVNRNIFIVGSDRSSNLTNIASQHQPHAAVMADVLHLPHPVHTFDFAISIAVIHHLSTAERRQESVRSILQVLKPSSEMRTGGNALLYVWALEQENSRRGWSEGDDQDVMVPWVLKGSKKSIDGQGSKESSNVATNGDRTFQRYYHLYRRGELEHDIEAAGGVVVEAGYEKDNWWAVARGRRGD